MRPASAAASDDLHVVRREVYPAPVTKLAQGKRGISNSLFLTSLTPAANYAVFFLPLSLFFMLQHSCLASLSCFIFSSCFIFMSQESPAQQSALASEFASPSFFTSHESSLQHDSATQQASVFFSCSPSAAVCALTAGSATSNNPSRTLRIVFLRGFIIVLPCPAIAKLH